MSDEHKIEALAEQPAGAVGEAWEASQIAASVLANIAKKFSAELSASEKASIESARIALTTPPAASVALEALRDVESALSAIFESGDWGMADDTTEQGLNALADLRESIASLDSAGGAKGDSRERVLEMFLGRIFAAQRVGDDGEYKGWKIAGRGSLNEVVDEARDYLNCPLTNTPQPDGGGGALDTARAINVLRRYRAEVGEGHDSCRHDGIKNDLAFECGMLDSLIKLLSRPSAAAAVRVTHQMVLAANAHVPMVNGLPVLTYGQVQELGIAMIAAAPAAPKGKVVAWLCSNDFPHRTVATASEGAMEAYRTLGRRIEPLVRQSEAPAAPKGGVVDWPAVEEAAREFVDDYEMMGEDEQGREGSYTPNEREKMLIMDAMFGLFADADFIAALATPRAEQGGQGVGNG